MNTDPNVSRFSIYRQPSSDKKRRKEAVNVFHLLFHLDEFIKLDDVQFGPEPPDFVFHHQGKQIGVELTDIDPKVFEKHGHVRRGNYNQWQSKIQPDSLPHEFPWEEFSLRESLAAFQERLKVKRTIANRWCNNFPERWLLMRIADGGPFREIIAGQQDMKVETEPRMEGDFADYRAKAMHSLYSICRDIHPFDYALLFRKTNLATSVCNLVTFPANPANPHQLSVPSDEILKHGASVPDCFLDRRPQRTTIITVQPGMIGGQSAS